MSKIRPVPQEVYNRIRAGIRGVIETIDVWWVDDFRPEMPEVYGETALVQRLLRRLTCPKGLFPSWPYEGLDTKQYLLSKVPLWRIKTDVEAECLRDEQVDRVIATPSYLNNNTVLRIHLYIEPVGGSAFDFTMTSDEASTRLVELQTGI